MMLPSLHFELLVRETRGRRRYESLYGTSPPRGKATAFQERDSPDSRGWASLRWIAQDCYRQIGPVFLRIGKVR